MSAIFQKISTLSPSDWAAWIQAIGVFIAIFFASSAASSQSKSQYENSIKLKGLEDYEKRLILTESVTEIFKNTSNQIKHIKIELHDRSAIYDAATKRKYYDLDCLTDLLNAFKQIPLHDLPASKLVTAVMISIATLRQLDIQIDKALREARTMDADDFEKVLITINQVDDSFQRTCSDVAAYLDLLKSQRPVS